MTVEVTPQPTPNPNAFKFTVPGRRFAPPVTFSDAEAAKGNRFAEAVFAVPGVRGIFATLDFVTVTKDPAADWARIAPAVKRALEATL
ncbi:MAG: NifU N-terminal domain-containing protein [Planctomycetota bacterium]